MALRNFRTWGNKRAVLTRLLSSNRLWVVTNSCLFVRAKHRPLRGVLETDWLFRRVWPTSGHRTGQVGALVMDLGRLGNALSRVTKSIALAIENEWSTVVIPRSGHFPAYRGLVSEAPVIRGSLRVSFGEERWKLSEAPTYLVRRDFNHSAVNPSPSQATAVRDIVRQIFSHAQGARPVDDDELVIHIRSGDIYFRPGVGNWGQPPYAYYEKIIRSFPWSRVTVVCEDERSPVIQPVSRLCAELGLPLLFQSSTLQEDLGVLVEARTLVVGRGSFAPAVVLMAAHLEKLFFFEDRFVTKFIDPQVDIVRIIDVVGTYRDSILGGKWVNSESQRELMVSYEVSALGFSGEVDDVRAV